MPFFTAAEAMSNVRTYGATGDGKTLDTPAVKRAIQAVALAGGGTLVFPTRTYVCRTIQLQSNVELYLSRGCVILAADSPKPDETTGYNGGTYGPAGPAQAWEAYQDYGHNHWANSFFYAEGMNNISFTGPGLIDGPGLFYGQGVKIGAKPRPLQGPGAQSRAKQAGVGNKTIGLKNCQNVTL